MQRELNHIDDEIELISHTLYQTPDDRPNMRPLLTRLGMVHNERYSILREIDDLHIAVKCLTIVLPLTPTEYPGLPNLLSTLGIAHGQRFRCLGDTDDLRQATEYIVRALALMPDSHPDFPRQLHNLALLHQDRFENLRDPDDLSEAIQYRSRALCLTPNDHPDLSNRLTSLAVSHNYRFTYMGELKDLEKAIEYQSRALALTPGGHQKLPATLLNLGVYHKDRFQRLGELNDLEKALEYEHRALVLIPDDHPDLLAPLANLGAAYTCRFERLGKLEDIEKAIEYQSRAMALTQDGDPSLPTILANLGISHKNRFVHLEEPDDLVKTIEYESRALALIPDGHPDLPRCLDNLGVSYTIRFQNLDEVNDLEKAIEYQSRALALTPVKHQDLSCRLANLGISRTNRFQRLGELGDVEKAIEYQSQAVALTANDHPDLPRRLDDLSVSHRDRFKRLGELNDLVKAVDYGSRALTLTPGGHPDLPTRLDNLGVSYAHRFQYLDEPDALEKAIEYQSRAIVLTPENYPSFPSRLADLGSLQMHQFHCRNGMDDLGKGIECYSRALTLTPNHHPHFPVILANLGGSHGVRFLVKGEMNDLEKAIEYESYALKLVTEEHPNFSLYHFTLALTYFRYYERTNDPAHLQKSLHSFRISCLSPTGAPRDRFRHALDWATSISRHGGLNCIEAYQTTIDLLPQFVWLGATTSQRYNDLKLIKGLAVDAASIAVRSSDYSLALEWLEHTRCVVWNQNLILRSPLDQLGASHPSLAARLEAVAQQLHSVSSESRELHALSSSISPEQVGQHHRRLAKEYNELLDQARSLPGFEGFLRPMKAGNLVDAARTGPVITISCQHDQCGALIILPRQQNISYLHLPNFTSSKAQAARSMIEISLKRQGLRERGVRIKSEPGDKDGFKNALAMLWNDIVQPTLAFLGYAVRINTKLNVNGLTNALQNEAPAHNLPHITWCPTGATSFLPLHAAGDYDQPRSRVFDYVISSYTPTLTALLATTPSTLDSNSRILAIGQETTPGHKQLPGIKAELSCIKSHVENKAEYSQLIESQATPLSVLDAMEQHDWVHLACHAHQNVYDSTKSGFFLYDGTLDLAAINQRSFKKKGLAFLSACQTATGDEELPDEAVHLASGMLMAGYSSVIATMWSVVDEDAPFVADKVYNQLMIDGTLGNGEAGKALHDAVAELRNKVEEKEFARWVPYIHLGC